ncbi:GlsB/YeaQ/YmgE family stress response membrane protein [Caenimonas sp. SL110]|uniref:GlsB/YeaQ/YmgE family stress response membrane protein n=1 Tax=Caenimonas sp. SL110 TaxID=1450524 RepID=UPI000654B448|nr:hypothetical protein [Caenimonas sp. SL110]
MGLHGFHAQKVSINTYIWCAVGAGIGWLLGTVLRKGASRTELVESILVGIFGAFIGGEFLAAQFHGKSPGVPGFAMGLGLAVAGSVVMLLLLGVMRKAVGPMKAGKSKQKNRN